MFWLLPIVFVSGILTVLSPCVLPILPVILGSGIEGDKKRINGVITGLVVSFTLFALILSSLVGLVGISADLLRILAAVLLGIFGLTLVFPKIWIIIQSKLELILPLHLVQKMGQTGQSDENNSKKNSFGGGFLTGAVLGLVWTPCVGPIVATVTTLASLQPFSPVLFVILFVYSLGIALPLNAIAHGGASVSRHFGWYKKNQAKVRLVFGIIIISTALLIGTGAEKKFQSWVLDNLPESISNPVGNFENRFQFDEDILKKDEKIDKKENEIINKVSLKIEEDGSKIDLSLLLDGCPRQDCIPSIDDPVFESILSIAKIDWLKNDDRVFVLNINGITKIYPQKIMNWHEIVNDWFGDKPIAVTFCPLCGSAVAFERIVDGNVTQFGVSGKLHNSDLVMYDRLEGSLWQQISGEAISGPAARRSEELQPILLSILAWEEVRQLYPEALVLSKKTGYIRDYDQYPYGSYEENGEIYFSVSNQDDRLHAKDWVYGIEIGKKNKAYSEDELLKVIKDSTIIEDKIGDYNIKITFENNEFIFVDSSTEGVIIPTRLFWFAWVAFHPNTELF